ncbi:unnamed protein product [Pleuronectes platessa]|uniref:Uncharacterized protein n=1 Tax=Pleuronectes platessa TaxID=8262 RepID=A0A9N7ULP2_PLEPL|nr:unnamed protein product [Pleuronectes platessa]
MGSWRVDGDLSGLLQGFGSGFETLVSNLRHVKANAYFRHHGSHKDKIPGHRARSVSAAKLLPESIEARHCFIASRSACDADSIKKKTGQQGDPRISTVDKLKEVRVKVCRPECTQQLWRGCNMKTYLMCYSSEDYTRAQRQDWACLALASFWE